MRFLNSEGNGDRVNFYRECGHAFFTFGEALRTQSKMLWTRHLQKNPNDVSARRHQRSDIKDAS